MDEVRVIEVRHAGRLARAKVNVAANGAPARGELVRLEGEFAKWAEGRVWRVARVTADRFSYGWVDLFLEPV